MKKGIIILIAIIVVIIIILIYNSNIQTEYEYQYKFEEGKLLVSYKQDKWIEVPGDFTKTIEKLEINNNGEYEEDTYQISKHKTIFYYEKEVEIETNSSQQTPGYKEEQYLVYTNDMGKNWATIQIPTNTILYLYFYDENNGHIVYQKNAAMQDVEISIETSADGGNTWSKAGNGPDGYIKVNSEIKFFNNELGFINKPSAGKEKADLYITRNGGKTYEKVILLEGNLEEDLNWSDVYDYYNIPTFENEILSVTVSQGADGDYNGGDTVTYISKDLGNTWEIQ